MSLAQSPLTHRQPEVGDFADVASPVVHQDHVLWLHVADDDVVVVAVLQPFGDVGQHAGVEGGKDVQRQQKQGNAATILTTWRQRVGSAGLAAIRLTTPASTGCTWEHAPRMTVEEFLRCVTADQKLQSSTQVITPGVLKWVTGCDNPSSLQMKSSNAQRRIEGNIVGYLDW